MSKYKDARDALNDALNLVVIDGPEWVKTKGAIAALDDAEVAEAKADFINASRRLDDAVAKLRAIVDGLHPNAASTFVERVTGVLHDLTSVVSNVDALLGGEPATALPGMVPTNQPNFPTAGEPIVPPVRETARGVAALDNAGEAGVAGVEEMIGDILRREGGFVDHPADRGGPTKFGITLRTLAASRGMQPQDLTPTDVRRMSEDEARQIYRSRYFTKPKIDQLPGLLQPLVFDMSINHGPGTAIKLLQQVLSDAGQSCSVDGGIGDETVDCANAAAAALGKALVNRLVDKRIALYRAIVSGDPSQGVFLKGWLNRASEFRMA